MPRYVSVLDLTCLTPLRKGILDRLVDAPSIVAAQSFTNETIAAVSIRFSSSLCQAAPEKEQKRNSCLSFEDNG